MKKDRDEVRAHYERLKLDAGVELSVALIFAGLAVIAVASIYFETMMIIGALATIVGAVIFLLVVCWFISRFHDYFTATFKLREIEREDEG